MCSYCTQLTRVTTYELLRFSSSAVSHQASDTITCGSYTDKMEIQPWENQRSKAVEEVKTRTAFDGILTYVCMYVGLGDGINLFNFSFCFLKICLINGKNGFASLISGFISELGSCRYLAYNLFLTAQYLFVVLLKFLQTSSLLIQP